MPVPPAVSCASDRASAPRLATVQKRREVGHCFNVRKVARCFCRRQKCAYEGGWLYTGFSPQKSHATERAQGLPVSRRRQRRLLLFRALCRKVFARCGIDKTDGFLFALAWCGQAKSKIRSHGVLFTAGVFPILSIAHSQEGGRFAPSLKAFATALCALPQGFCSLRNYKTGGFPRR